MIYNIQFKKSVIEAVLIVVIASLIGFIVNLFHPNGAVIALSRPNAAYVANEVLKNEKLTTEAELTEPVVINREQLKKLLTDNQAALLDARMPEAYAEGHLPGAVNVPFEMLGQFIDKIEALSRESWIITYCDGPPCDLSELLGHELINMDFKFVAFYQDGLDDWLTAGEPVTRGGQ